MAVVNDGFSQEKLSEWSKRFGFSTESLLEIEAYSSLVSNPIEYFGSLYSAKVPLGHIMCLLKDLGCVSNEEPQGQQPPIIPPPRRGPSFLVRLDTRDQPEEQQWVSSLGFPLDSSMKAVLKPRVASSLPFDTKAIHARFPTLGFGVLKPTKAETCKLVILETEERMKLLMATEGKLIQGYIPALTVLLERKVEDSNSSEEIALSSFTKSILALIRHTEQLQGHFFVILVPELDASSNSNSNVALLLQRLLLTDSIMVSCDEDKVKLQSNTETRWVRVPGLSTREAAVVVAAHFAVNWINGKDENDAPLLKFYEEKQKEILSLDTIELCHLVSGGSDLQEFIIKEHLTLEALQQLRGVNSSTLLKKDAKTKKTVLETLQMVRDQVETSQREVNKLLDEVMRQETEYEEQSQSRDTTGDGEASSVQTTSSVETDLKSVRIQYYYRERKGKDMKCIEISAQIRGKVISKEEIKGCIQQNLSDGKMIDKIYHYGGKGVAGGCSVWAQFEEIALPEQVSSPLVQVKIKLTKLLCPKPIWAGTTEPENEEAMPDAVIDALRDGCNHTNSIQKVLPHPAQGQGKHSRTVWAWGDNSGGRLGVNQTVPKVTSPAIVSLGLQSLEEITKCCSTATTSFFVTSSGTVYASGKGAADFISVQPEQDNLPSLSVRIMFPDGVSVKRIGAGKNHIIAISTEGDAYGWGGGNWGQLATGEPVEFQKNPAKMKVLDGEGLTFSRLACGRDFTFLLTDDNKVYSCGRGDKGQLGFKASEQPKVSLLTKVPWFADKTITSIAAGKSTGIAADDMGIVYRWGFRKLYQQLIAFQKSFGIVDEDSDAPAGAIIPHQVVFGKYTRVFHGPNHQAILTAAGDLFIYLTSKSKTILSSSSVMDFRVPSLEHLWIVDVAIGQKHFVVLSGTGEVYSWGDNSFAQQGTPFNRTPRVDAPRKIEGLSHVNRIFCGYNHTFAVSDYWEGLIYSLATNNGSGDDIDTVKRSLSNNFAKVSVPYLERVQNALTKTMARQKVSFMGRFLKNYLNIGEARAYIKISKHLLDFNLNGQPAVLKGKYTDSFVIENVGNLNLEFTLQVWKEPMYQGEYTVSFTPSQGTLARNSKVEIHVTFRCTTPKLWTIPVTLSTRNGMIRFLVIEVESKGANQGWEIDPREIKFTRLIGKGATATVMAGIWRETEVAVKKWNLADLTGSVMDNFESEVKILSTLKHPNIVLFMGACANPSMVCIVMELMTKGSLYKVLHQKQRMLHPMLMIKIARDIAEGLNWIHKAGYAHCDLKSLNVLIDRQWVAKVADFGFSISTAGNADCGAGTYPWMSPEMIQDKKFTIEGDMYSYGILLCEFWSKKIPYADLELFDMKKLKVDPRHSPVDYLLPLDCNPRWKQLAADCCRFAPQDRIQCSSLLIQLKQLTKQTLN